MNGNMLHLLIRDGLWLLLIAGWSILLADAVGILRFLGEIGAWVVFVLVSCLLPVTLWWTFAPLR